MAHHLKTHLLLHLETSCCLWRAVHLFRIMADQKIPKSETAAARGWAERTIKLKLVLSREFLLEEICEMPGSRKRQNANPEMPKDRFN